MNFLCAALGADPETDEGMCVAYYPLSKWGDHWPYENLLEQAFQSPLKLTQIPALPLIGYVNTGRFYLHSKLKTLAFTFKVTSKPSKIYPVLPAVPGPQETSSFVLHCESFWDDHTRNVKILPHSKDLPYSTVNYTQGLTITAYEKESFKENRYREFLVVQWLGHHVFTAEGLGSVPGLRTKITQVHGVCVYIYI